MFWNKKKEEQQQSEENYNELFDKKDTKKEEKKDQELENWKQQQIEKVKKADEDSENIYKRAEELTDEQKKELKKEAKKKIAEVSEKNTGSVKEEGKKIITEEKVNTWFNNIEILSLDDDHKQAVALKVREDSVGDRTFYIAIVLSALIATLGLLQNSVAVVIGAMLIAPFLKPMNGLSFAVARGGKKISRDSFFALLFAVLLSIFIGFIVTALTGLEKETTEVIARVNPNLIDFFVALFSGMLAVMSLRFPKLGEGVAGVAMAAALMPPLSVVGIELAIGNYSESFGALMLFGTNVIAIVLISTVFFWLYGFTPHASKYQSSTFRRIAIIFFSLIIILIPLIASFNSVKVGNRITEQTRQSFEKFLSKHEDMSFAIENIQVYNQKNGTVRIEGLVKIPVSYNIKAILLDIKKELESEIGKNVQLDVDIVPRVSIK